MAISTGIYSADGSWRVSVVTGAVYTGLHAIDGSYNVVGTTGSTWVGISHPCGAYWVTPITSAVNTLFSTNGSYYVSTSPYQTGAAKITVVAGSFSGGTSTTSGMYYYYLGF